MIPFDKARFLLSALTQEEMPQLKNDQGKPLFEVAIAGRSNVGKSTLINQLLRTKLAKTSSTPGKTQRIVFFLVDEKLLLVDLPGYGYSKAQKQHISSWSMAIEDYLNQRQNLSLILLLIDSRRGPSAEDLSMIQWAEQKEIPLAVIFTKCDKLLPSKQDHLLNRLKQAISGNVETLHFSSQDPTARKKVIQYINQRLSWEN